MRDAERRFTPVPVEVRGDGQRGARISGYAALFEKLSRNLGGFVEVVTSSFFNHTRAAGWPDVICRYNHDDNMLLGSSGSGTLKLGIDETGLLYDVLPPQARADVLELVQRGDVRKSSFAFMCDSKGDEWVVTDQGYPLRRLVSGQLFDVAPVNMPAYPDTSAGTRALALRSLASTIDAPFDDVIALADKDELRKVLVRTDGAPNAPIKRRPRTTFGPAAAVQILRRDRDPWDLP